MKKMGYPFLKTTTHEPLKIKNDVIDQQTSQTGNAEFDKEIE